MSSNPLWREPAGAATKAFPCGRWKAWRPRGRVAASQPRLGPPAPVDPSPSPSRRASAADAGGKCFSRPSSSFSAWLSSRSRATAWLSFSFSPRRRVTSPTNWRTKSISSDGVFPSSKICGVRTHPQLGITPFLNLSFPPRNLPRLQTGVTWATTPGRRAAAQISQGRRSRKRLRQLDLAIAAFCVVQLRTREFAPVTATLLKVLNNLADIKSAGVLHFASELRLPLPNGPSLRSHRLPSPSPSLSWRT